MMAHAARRAPVAARGYQAGGASNGPGRGLAIPFVPMTKRPHRRASASTRVSSKMRRAILELQKLAYQSEARLYEDWTLPPLTQTLGSSASTNARAP